MDDLLRQIQRGNYDDQLEALAEGVRSRLQRVRARRAEQTFDELQVGNVVVIHDVGMGGKYLNGSFGVIQKKRLKKLEVRLLGGATFRGHPVVVMPANLVQPVRNDEGAPVTVAEFTRRTLEAKDALTAMQDR